MCDMWAMTINDSTWVDSDEICVEAGTFWCWPKQIWRDFYQKNILKKFYIVKNWISNNS